MKTIKIEISPAGNVDMDLTGFKGKSCAKITEQIQLVLGGESKVDKKPEYNLPETLGVSTQNRI